MNADHGSRGEPSYGIEGLNVYCGAAAIPVPALFEGRGLDPSRLGNLDMQARSIALPCEDPVTHAVNAAGPLLDTLDPEERASIEILITSTESGVDYSKSIASYVHRALDLPATCRLIEVKQACYAATAAVQLAVGYLASGVAPGSRALVIATDVSLVDGRAEYAEPAMGTGAAALLISHRPRILAVDLGAFGNHSYETMDSARPSPEFDIADVDGSLFAYLDCLSRSFDDYRSRVEGADFATTFAGLAFHTPFAGLVQAAHRKMMREHTGASVGEIAEDFQRRVEPSLTYSRAVGNLCSGAVYLALAGLVESGPRLDGERVGLYAYGSGCSSEFFSGVVGEEARQVLGRMAIAERLQHRRTLSFEDYEALLEENRCCLVPVADRRIEVDRYQPYFNGARARPRHLVLTGIENYHRKYQWI